MMGADEIIFFKTTCAFGPDLAIRRSPLGQHGSHPLGQIPNNS
jgi:hypothetical protein